MARTAKEKPPTEIKLSDLQTKWFETKNPKYLQEMFEELVGYSKSLCLKINRGKIFLEPSKVMGIAVDSAATFMEYYKDPDFITHSSFAGLLRLKVLENLYGNRPKDKNKDPDRYISLNGIIGDGSSEFGDLLVKFGIEKLWTPIIEDINIKENCVKEDLNKIFLEYDEAVNSLRLSFLSRLYFMLSITVPQKKLEQHFEQFINRMKLNYSESKTLEILILEIRNKLKTESSVQVF